MRRLSFPATARAVGYAAVALAITAGALEVRQGGTDGPGVPGAAPADPLAAALARCRETGMAAKDDAACEAASAENRRRFVTDRPADGAASRED
jgi:conjugative transfer region protein TrbK